ncbi:CDP-alcohol phosphatidyltransferase family protein [Patescibacteria group bacterium]|nr:CDP-alcohol phosphatidyltransferase family protein [Patescibacteria group bacterium]
MKNVKILDCRKEPYPHDYIIDKVFLWMLPESFIKPNHITIFRMLAAPFVWLFVIRNDWMVAIPVFIVVALTDALDGAMARTRNQITAWGTLFDPVADKLLVGGMLFILILKYVNIFIGGAIIALEMAVIIGGWLKRHQGIVISAGRWGKSKMVLQVMGISLIMLSLLLGSIPIMLIAEWTLILSIGFAILNIFGKGWTG